MKLKTMLVLLAVLSISTAAYANIYTVDSTDDNPDASVGIKGCADENGKCTLRAAIEEANNHYDYGAEMDIIVVPSGQYVLNSFIKITSGKLKIFGTGDMPPQINGQNSVNIFIFDKKAVVEIDNIWITGGKVEGPGAAINNFGQSTLKNVTIEDSEGTTGGGINNDMDAKLVISDSFIKDNVASFEGGGIYNHPNAMLIITDSVIAGNKSNKNGGGLSNHGDMELKRIEISGNTAGKNGGGIFNTTDKETSLHESAVINNVSSGEGGGIYNSGTMDVMNCTISGNKAATYGGGVRATGKKSLMLSYVTIADNDALGSGGGVMATSVTGIANKPVVMSNTIVARNKAADKMDVDGADCAGEVKSLGHNLFGNVDGCNLNDSKTDQKGTKRALKDPMLAQLGSYGGPTKTHDLLSNSPALDKGICFIEIDQREIDRPKGNACDIGAVEHEGGVNPPAAAKGVGKGYEGANIPMPKPK
jgi:CSLREA domain-containing protein